MRALVSGRAAAPSLEGLARLKRERAASPVVAETLLAQFAERQAGWTSAERHDALLADVDGRLLGVQLGSDGGPFQSR